MTNKISLIRLTSGEELLAEITASYTLGKMTINDISIIIPTDEGLAVGRFMPYADLDEGLDLNVEAILFMTEPNAELLAHYRSIFPETQQIITPESKIVY